MINLGRLVVIALIGAAGWYGYRAIKRHMKHVGDELDNAEQGRQIKDVTLEQDKDGVYRPKDDE